MSNFSKQKIFQDSSINAVLDRIMYELEQGVPGADFVSSFALTGRAAAIIQEEVTGNCDNIVFITNDIPIYQFITNVLPERIKTTGVIRFRERVLFYIDGLHLEFWYTDEEHLYTKEYNNIICQNYNVIPPILL